MPGFRPVSFLLAAVLLVGLTTGADATKLPALTDDELIDRADAIVTGECVEVRTEWRGRMMVTAARIEVGEVLKDGRAVVPGEVVTVVTPGGIDHDREIPIAMVFPGAPAIAPGEDLLLFLTAGDDPGTWFVTGLSQGKLSLVEDASGETLVYRDLSGVELVDGTGSRRGGRSAGTLARVEEHVARRLAENGAR